MQRFSLIVSKASTITLLSAASAQASLPFTQGDYVRDGVACKDAPFAALMRFDGAAFSGPHDSDCSTTVVSRNGPRYKLKTTCRAAGDGSPQKPYTEAQIVTVLSPSHFRFSHAGGVGSTDNADFRLCLSRPNP